MRRGLQGGLVAALLLSILVPGLAIFATGRSNPVYATVNGRAITARDVRERLAIYQLADPSQAAALGTKAFVPSVVERLVDERILLTAAKNEGVVPNTVDMGTAQNAVTSSLLKDVYGTRAALAATETRLGVTPQGLKRYARTEATIAAFLRRKIPTEIPSEAAVKAYYRAHAGTYRTKSLVRVRQLTFATKDAARRALVALLGGRSWGGAAKVAKQGTVAKDAWVLESELQPMVRRALSGLPVGKPSGIVAIGAGYAIVEATGREPARQLTEAEAAPEIRSYLSARTEAERVAAYTASLRAKSNVVLTLPRGA